MKEEILLQCEQLKPQLTVLESTLTAFAETNMPHEDYTESYQLDQLKMGTANVLDAIEAIF